MTRTSRELTATFVKQVKWTGKAAGDKHYDGGGLHLLVKEAGKYWRLDYRFAGKARTLALGVYPAVGLADARKGRERAKASLAKGEDPGLVKRQEKVAKAVASENTFKAVALDWHATKTPGWSAVHASTTIERLEKNAFPWIGLRPITDLEAPELVALLRRIQDRGAMETAHRVRAIISAVFSYAIATGRATRNPAAGLGVALKTTVKGHHPAIIEPKRYGQLLRDIYAYQGSPITRAALKIHAFTFQRPGEVSGMTWAEVDLDAGVWTIPAARMKGRKEAKAKGQPHIVKLSDQALAVLKDLHPLTGSGPNVFPSERGEGRTISENTARQALRSMGYSDHVPHGFRASARTMIREYLHYDKDVIERQLSHGSDEELGGAYDRTQFYAERAKMMQDWCDYQDRVRIGAEVIPIRGAA